MTSHPIQHRTHVAPRAAAAVRPPLLLEQRLDDRSLLVGQVDAPRHDGSIEVKTY